MKNKHVKILGMGNALVDILIKLENDNVLATYDLPKGSMQLVDRLKAEKVLAGTEDLDKTIASGGSAANTIHGLAALGVGTGFIGTIGKDHWGELFEQDMKSNNIEPKLIYSDTESGRAVALVSKDSERTFATFLGAAVELSADDIDEKIFRGYDYFHVEGYLVQNKELIRKAVIMAKQLGLKVSLDLASYNVVEDNLEMLRELVKNNVDILFANEEEAKAFTGKEPDAAIIDIAKDVEIAIVKLGKNGSIIKRGNKYDEVGVIKADSIDTTGAGDLYASGFLYGLINGKTLKRSGEIGALLSGRVIEIIGPKPDKSMWDEIRELIKSGQII
ncbi:MAG: adenosine kinase [Bacteroidetes bacterium]|nr:adenosine kinase [Bacteroidota bacterium]